MTAADFKIGQKVYFGSKNGQKTLAEIVRLNAKSAKVRTLEQRGYRNGARVGEEWNVTYGLMTPAEDVKLELIPAKNLKVGQKFTFPALTARLVDGELRTEARSPNQPRVVLMRLNTLPPRAVPYVFLEPPECAGQVACCDDENWALPL